MCCYFVLIFLFSLTLLFPPLQLVDSLETMHVLWAEVGTHEDERAKTLRCIHGAARGAAAAALESLAATKSGLELSIKNKIKQLLFISKVHISGIFFFLKISLSFTFFRLRLSCTMSWSR